MQWQSNRRTKKNRQGRFEGTGIPGAFILQAGPCFKCADRASRHGTSPKCEQRAGPRNDPRLVDLSVPGGQKLAANLGGLAGFTFSVGPHANASASEVTRGRRTVAKSARVVCAPLERGGGAVYVSCPRSRCLYSNVSICSPHRPSPPAPDPPPPAPDPPPLALPCA